MSISDAPDFAWRNSSDFYRLFVTDKIPSDRVKLTLLVLTLPK